MKKYLFNGNKDLYIFGPFRLDAAQRTLHRDGQAILLPRKVFDLLLLMVSSEQNLKSRDELFAALWPNTIVDEQGLATKMCALRKTLGDNGKEPRYIETVRGVGYRFIVPVEIEPVEKTGSNAGAQAPHSFWFRIGIPAVLLAAIFIVGVATWNLVLHPFASKVSSASLPSIAVLPFENLSADSGNAYFVSGIQNEILTRLAATDSLKVISHTLTAQYASHPGDLRAIARQLGVSAVLEGSVQKVGNKVRINVRLIDARTYAHLWAHSYDRELKDVFNVEGDVAQKIADAVRTKLLSAETARRTRPPTADP